jgi:hypothetical protein
MGSGPFRAEVKKYGHGLGMVNGFTANHRVRLWGGSMEKGSVMEEGEQLEAVRGKGMDYRLKTGFVGTLSWDVLGLGETEGTEGSLIGRPLEKSEDGEQLKWNGLSFLKSARCFKVDKGGSRARWIGKTSGEIGPIWKIEDNYLFMEKRGTRQSKQRESVKKGTFYKNNEIQWIPSLVNE